MELVGYEPDTNHFLSYLLVENRLKEVYTGDVGTCDIAWVTEDGEFLRVAHEYY